MMQRFLSGFCAFTAHRFLPGPQKFLPLIQGAATRRSAYRSSASLPGCTRQKNLLAA
jgi:hypothetical protein